MRKRRKRKRKRMVAKVHWEEADPVVTTCSCRATAACRVIKGKAALPSVASYPLSHPTQACPRNLIVGSGRCRKDNRQKTKHAQSWGQVGWALGWRHTQ
jgi:hypothetical protein